MSNMASLAGFFKKKQGDSYKIRKRSLESVPELSTFFVLRMRPNYIYLSGRDR